MVLENLDQDQKINLPRVSTTVGLNLTLALRSCEQTFWRKLTALQRWTFKIVFERKKNISWFAVSCFFNVFLWWLWSQLFQAGFYFNFFSGWFSLPFFSSWFSYSRISGWFSISAFSGWFSVSTFFGLVSFLFNFQLFRAGFQYQLF